MCLGKSKEAVLALTQGPAPSVSTEDSDCWFGSRYPVACVWCTCTALQSKVRATVAAEEAEEEAAAAASAAVPFEG